MNIDTRVKNAYTEDKKENLSYTEARHALEEKFQNKTKSLNNKDTFDVITKPPHYNHGKYETIEVIEDWKLNYHCGNAVKYISRHRHKGKPLEDIKKAVWYLQRYMQVLEEEESA